MKITQNPQVITILEQAFGEQWLTNLSNMLGYQEEVINNEYVEAVGNKTMDDPSGATEEVDMLDGKTQVPSQVLNPDYIEAIGERVKDNPVDRADAVEAEILERGLAGVFTLVLDRRVQNFKVKDAALLKGVQDAIRQTITTS